MLGGDDDNGEEQGVPRKLSPWCSTPPENQHGTKKSLNLQKDNLGEANQHDLGVNLHLFGGSMLIFQGVMVVDECLDDRKM